jgi:hypothetical protein
MEADISTLRKTGHFYFALTRTVACTVGSVTALRRKVRVASVPQTKRSVKGLRGRLRTWIVGEPTDRRRSLSQQSLNNATAPNATRGPGPPRVALPMPLSGRKVVSVGACRFALKIQSQQIDILPVAVRNRE